MPGQTRVGDASQGTCSIGEDCCPHNWIGVAITGSAKETTDGRFSCRNTDLVSTTCPHCPIGVMIPGSPKKYIDNLQVHRLGDVVILGCGSGNTISSSGSVIID